MFQTMEMAPPDAILGLTEAFKQDTNPNKINLSVGVYQDSSGKTPILEVVKEAEARLLNEELNKSYLGIDGLPAYGAQVRAMLFGEEHPLVTANRAVTAQTPGGTGALRVAADFLKQKVGTGRIWCSKPTWANHPSVFKAAGLQVETYPYLDQSGTRLDFDAMISAVKRIPAGDAICLHACCHNPTGVDPSVNQWREIGEVVQQQGVLPLVDFAYQGFADGLEEDASGLRMLTELCPEMLICSSFSKNFGLYGERVGAMTAVADSEEAARVVLSHVKICIRTNYSNPPKHGGAIVATVLNDVELRAKWVVELAEMRERIRNMRQLFVDTLQAKGVERDFSFIPKQRGMFSFSGLTPVHVDALRNQYSIYIVGSGRINVAGMTEANMDLLCDSIKAVL
jgi:aspartate/tyrosine/aromatic aminotransferase